MSLIGYVYLGNFKGWKLSVYRGGHPKPMSSQRKTGVFWDNMNYLKSAATLLVNRGGGEKEGLLNFYICK